MRTSGPALRATWVVLVLGAAATVLVQGLVAAGIGGESMTTAISDLGGILIIGAAATIVIRTALRFERGEPVRRQWLAVGTGIVLYVLGDVVWSWYELALRVEPPFPGPPDIFYMAMYAFLGYGLITAALAYRTCVDPRRPLVTSLLVGTTGWIVLYLSLLEDILADPTMGWVERVVNLYYPSADVIFLLGPAVFALLVVARLGRGLLAVPWRLVVTGVALIAVSDTAYQWLEWRGTYASGDLVDAGWMLGWVAIAAAGMAMREIAAPAR